MTPEETATLEQVYSAIDFDGATPSLVECSVGFIRYCASKRPDLDVSQYDAFPDNYWVRIVNGAFTVIGEAEEA